MKSSIIVKTAQEIKKSPSVFFKTSGPLAVPTLTKITVR